MVGQRDIVFSSNVFKFPNALLSNLNFCQRMETEKAVLAVVDLIGNGEHVHIVEGKSSGIYFLIFFSHCCYPISCGTLYL